MNWLALDIGGANLKAADGACYAASEAFPLWKKPHELVDALSGLLAKRPAVDCLAVTMTGELADCFRTKAEGVQFIVRGVMTAAEQRQVRVYLTDGSFALPQQAIENPLLAAASNWHALARFAARYVKQSCGLLIDIGSTTTDIIPLVDGQPVTIGHTDPDRLIHGELVYTGVERSPVCAVSAAVPWRNTRCPTAQELFATMWDVYLTLGDLPEELHNTHTADGQPATRAAARDRLARQICADRTMFGEDEARTVSLAVAREQVEKIATCVRQVLGRLPIPSPTIIVSGRGEFLAEEVLTHLGITTATISLGACLGPGLSRVATAHALAVLAREELR